MTDLTRAEIDDILRLIDGSDFQELKLEMGGMKLEVRRKGAAPAAAGVPVPPAAAPSSPPPVQPSAPAVAAPAAAAPAGGGVDVPAPLLGTFYHAPRPGADAFIKPGDSVTADSIIGIIEVMKLMNSVPAGVSGVVAEIVAPNGALVEHGQTLIRVRPQ
jgi:acetyl-CoA carboxylase biotin carboxyl carrier protein